MMATESMHDPIPAEAGEMDPPRPDGIMGLGIPVAHGRDAQTDSRDQSEAAGQMSAELDMSGYLLKVHAGYIAGEKLMGGWEKTPLPSGAAPQRVNTSGTRGAQDVGKL